MGGKRSLEVILAIDLAADVADQPAQPCAPDAQFSAVAVLGGQAAEALDGRLQQLGVGREADVLGLNCG
jgi:hypothetical protein